MKQNYHVRDPEFWKKLREMPGRMAHTTGIPNIGDTSIELTTGFYATLAGGTVTKVEIFFTQPKLSVLVWMGDAPAIKMMTNVRHSSQPGDSHSITWSVRHRVQDHGGTRSVIINYHPNNPNIIFIHSHDENPSSFDRRDWETDTVYATIAMSVLEQAIRPGALKKVDGCYKLPIKNMLHPMRPQTHFTFFKEVTSREIRRTFREVLEYVRFVKAAGSASARKTKRMQAKKK